MPPRKIKRDPTAVKIAEELENPINALVDDLDAKLKAIVVQTARSEVARFLSMIPKEVQDMNLMDFLNGPPVDLFKLQEDDIAEEESETTEEEVQEETEEAEKENMAAPEKLAEPNEPIDHEMDDAAHETSIPIVHSAHNSGRNTATERHELITPAGHILPVPHTIYPKIDATSSKPFRLPHLDEEIAFSVNGSPMVLPGSRTVSHTQDKRTTAEKGQLKPKIERESIPEAGTAV